MQRRQGIGLRCRSPSRKRLVRSEWGLFCVQHAGAVGRMLWARVTPTEFTLMAACSTYRYANASQGALIAQ